MIARLTVFVLAMLLTGCAAPGSNPAPKISAVGTEPVMLTVGHRTEWRVLWIEGDTDLPDGALVNYRATHELAQSTPPSEWPAANIIDSGRATVQGGQYWARINTLNWPRGEVQLLVQFPLPPQPPAVLTQYGDFGEHLVGENVTDLGGIKVVEVKHLFEHTR